MKLSNFYNKKSKAFTLVEMIIVIVIISVISIATLPRLFQTERFELAAFHNQALNAIRYAQKVSISMGCEVQVSHTSNSISLNMRDSCTTGSFTTAIDSPGNVGAAYVKTAPSGITITSSGFPIYFDRAGRARNSGGTVANATMQINTKDISVIGESGYAYEP